MFPRRSGVFRIAPLTSMYFLGSNDRRPNSDFRTELHDPDGLQIHNDNPANGWATAQSGRRGRHLVVHRQGRAALA